EGWLQPGDGSALPPMGRGFLAGDDVFWPTRDGLRVLNQTNGEQPDDLIPGPLEHVAAGNLVYGKAGLAVADSRVLSIYPAPGLLLPRREGEVKDAPRSAVVHYRRALAEADAGELSHALEDFRDGGQLARPGECWQGER